MDLNAGEVIGPEYEELIHRRISTCLGEVRSPSLVLDENDIRQLRNSRVSLSERGINFNPLVITEPQISNTEDNKMTPLTHPEGFVPLSLTPLYLIAFFYYFSLLIFMTSIPALFLDLTDDDSSKSSTLNGISTFLRYFFSFIFSPTLGYISDNKGRKYVFYLGFLTNAIQGILLAIFLDIPLIIITQILVGCSDAILQVIYTMATDIALHNKETMTKVFAPISGMIGLALIAGPITAGILISINIRFCFIVGAASVFTALLITATKIKETVHINRHPDMEIPVNSISFSRLNPFPALYRHLSDAEMRDFSVPIFISTFLQGAASIIYIYIDYRWNTSSILISIYLAFSGIGVFIAQAFVLNKFVPSKFSEAKASIFFFICYAINCSIISGSPVFPLIYAAIPFSSFGLLSDVTLKSMIVAISLRKGESSTDENFRPELIQGNLQGVIASLKTLGLALGSLFFSNIFTAAIDFKHPAPYLPFTISLILYLLGAFWIYCATKKHGIYEKTPIFTFTHKGESSDTKNISNVSDN